MFNAANVISVRTSVREQPTKRLLRNPTLVSFDENSSVFAATFYTLQPTPQFELLGRYPEG
jgi:hypothetical protein